MLDEYAITPDVFDPSAYSSPEVIEICLSHLREPLLQEALVRDLCGGSWSKFCMANSGNLHRYCKEIVRKLAQGNRLRRFPQQFSDEALSAGQWCEQGLGSSAIEALTGVITTHATKRQFEEGEVASIEKLTGTPWWQRRSPTISIDRKTSEYQRVLHRVLAQANSLMFIDPNLDPSSYNYGEFAKLFAPLARREIKPRIEVHRSFCKGDGAARTFPSEAYWKEAFASFSRELGSIGLTAEVFLWDDFHIRLLITDLIGMQLECGFDVTTKADELTVWSRLGRTDRDTWQRRFDPAAKSPKGRFVVGL